MHVKSSEAKRRHVLSASADVFRTHGYSRTTMGDLAKAAGMSRPALYLVFARKEAVFSTLLSEDDAARSRSDQPAWVSWLLWACSLWTGRCSESGEGEGEGPSQHEKHSEYMLIERLLREGIEARSAPSGHGEATADVARLVASCMRGLSEIPISDGERRRLLAVQIDSVARAFGWVLNRAAENDSLRQTMM